MKRLFLAALAAFLVTAPAQAVTFGQSTTMPGPAFDGRVMVRFAPNEAASLRTESLRGLARMRSTSAALRGLSTAYEVRAAAPALADRALFSEARQLGLDRWFEIEVDPAAGFDAVAARLRAQPGVELVEPALVSYTLTVVPNDSLFSKNWGHGNTGTFPAWQISTLQHTGSNVGTVGFDANVQGGWGAPSGYGDSTAIVAIMDGGVDPTHPDLRQVTGYDAVYNNNNAADSTYHGTACAGIAAGRANNTRGVAGAAGGCKIMALKIFSPSKATTVQMFLNAVAYAVNNGADVLSMSFEIQRFQVMADVLTAADAAGVVIFSSTNNENNAYLRFPANHPKVIAVGAASPCASRKRSSKFPGELNPNVTADSLGTSCDGETFWGSTYGVAVKDDSAAVDILGPTELPTTDVQGAPGYSGTGYSEYFNGTSCATPYVAGVAALIRSQHPSWTSAQVRARLMETAIDISDVQTPVGWDKYTGYGMVNAGLPDLVPFAFGGWSSPIVPRPAPDANAGSVPAPTTLNGDVNSYLNVGLANLGEAASGNDAAGLYVDDVEAGGGIGYNLPAGAGGLLNNIAWTIRGGRHVVGVKVNKNNDIDESNESNNRNAHQWSWVPATMPTSVSTVVSRLTPPNRNAGRADVPVSETTYDNVDAVRMVGPELFTSAEFWLMSVHPSDNATDLDMGLHFPTSSATANFTPANLYIQSTQSAGKTEWAIVNLGTNQLDQMDVASLLVSGTGQTRLESRLSGAFATTTFAGTNTSISGSLASDQMVMIRELFVTEVGAGGVALELDAAAGVHFAVYDPPFEIALRSSASRLSTVQGLVQGATWTAAQGRYAIVIYRDRTEGTGPINFNITVRRPTAELVASTAGGTIIAPAGVYKDGVGNATSQPTVLDGNVNNTRFYYGYSNTGTVAGSGFTAREVLDGATVLTWTPGTLNPGAHIVWTSSLRNIRGGRHTMGFLNDFGQSIDEFNEIDNDYAVQKVWSALPLTVDVPVSRTAPPDPTGGWAQVPTAVTKYDNVDGLKIPMIQDDGTNGFWWFAASTPRTLTDDVDLRVYQGVSTGPGTGFTVPTKASTFPAGRTDLLGFDAYGYRPVDLGLVKAGAATGNVVAQVTKSLSLNTDTGTFGPYTLDPDELVAAFELHIVNNPNRQVRLINLSGNANLDLRMFDHQVEDSIFVPLLPNQGWVAEANGDGMDEVIQYGGYFGAFPAVVVTKRGSGDVSKTATFQIQIGNSTIGTDDPVLPTAVRLSAVRPNPVQANAAVQFALPRASRVSLTAYDVAGRHVATLTSGDWAAGWHTVNWNARSSEGVALASGVYLLRLEAEGVESVQRVVVTR